MNNKPGGTEEALALLYAAGVAENSRVLDMGAGAGECVDIMRKMGMDAVGIDLEPMSDSVERGDFLHCPYPSGSFDAIITQNAFHDCENLKRAFCEAGRLLKKGGTFIISDKCTEDWKPYLDKAGLVIKSTEDNTGIYRSAYLENLWQGKESEEFDNSCHYYAMICEKSC